jgi:P27 family predicted phage terminase small subunit
MGARGPAPKPTALRLIDGDREDRINRHEPTPRAGAMECPDDTPDDVRAVFDYTAHELEHMGIDTPADRDALLCFCWAVRNHREASKVLARTGMLIQNRKRGDWVRNPMLIEQGKAAAIIRAFAQEFGLTPSARSRIVNQAESAADDDNPFASAH